MGFLKISLYFSSCVGDYLLEPKDFVFAVGHFVSESDYFGHDLPRLGPPVQHRPILSHSTFTFALGLSGSMSSPGLEEAFTNVVKERFQGERAEGQTCQSGVALEPLGSALACWRNTSEVRQRCE